MLPDVDLPFWINLLLVAGAVAGSLVVVAGFMVKTGRGVKWVKDAVRDGVAEVAREQALEVGQVAKRRAEDLREQVEADNAQLAELIAEITAEVQPNGGQSLRDAVDRVEVKLDSHIDHSAQDRKNLWDAVRELREPER